MPEAIVDAHHHIWRQRDLPWLMGPMLPRIFGPYEPIRRDYPIGEYLADIAGSGRGEIGLCPGELGAGERRGGSRLCAAGRGRDRLSPPWHRRLRRPPCPRTCWPMLDRLMRYPPVARYPHAASLARKSAIPLRSNTPDVADDPVFRRNFAAFAEYGLSFDLQVFALGKWSGAARLAGDFPKTTFILEHGWACWKTCPRPAGRRGGRRCRSSPGLPNVVAKLPVLGTFIHRNDPKEIAWIVKETVGLFGPFAVPVRLELPDREAVDGLWVAGACLPGRGGGIFRGRPGRDAA